MTITDDKIRYEQKDFFEKCLVIDSAILVIFSYMSMLLVIYQYLLCCCFFQNYIYKRNKK